MSRGATIRTSLGPMVLETCCRCKVAFAMPAELQRTARQSSAVNFYCPHGHQQHYVEGPTEAERLRRERDRLAQRDAERADEIRRLEERLAHEEARTRGYQGAYAKVKKRVGKGSCPCCNRHFTNLERHMATKHPEYAKAEEQTHG